MTGELVLGVDIGTYSSKGILATAGGDILASAVIDHGLSVPRPGWAEHDADGIWWGDVAQLCRRLLGQGFSGADIGGVAISAIGSCLLPVDRNGKALRPGILYGIDTRATAEIAWLNERFGEDAMLALGGMALTSQSIGPKILWLRRNEPDIYARTHKVLSAAQYAVLKLTGEFVMDRHSASYYNPLFDLETGEWDPRFAEPIIDLDKLPDLRWADEVAGTVTAAAAAETGLAVGTPVTAGTIDAAAEALSVGVVAPGDMMCMYGSTLFFINLCPRPVADRRMWATAYLHPGQFAIEGGLSTAGALTRWFRDNLAHPEISAEAAGGPNAYAALAELAGSVAAGANGLVCLPYFSGERTPINDPHARGMYAGLDLTHTRAHLYRASLEGTAYGVRHNLETMAAIGAAPARIVAVGGGAQNRTWLQIVSDVTGVEQELPSRTIGAALGDAMLAGVAAGIILSLNGAIDQWVTTADHISPNPAHRATFDEYYAIYRALYNQTVEQMHRLAALARQGG